MDGRRPPSCPLPAGSPIRERSRLSAEALCCSWSRPGFTPFPQESGAGSAKRAKGARNDTQILRHRRDPRDHQPRADDGGDRAARRAGRRRALPARRSSSPGRDRQGHAAFRLHDGIGDGRRFHQRRHGRGASGADADAGGRDADAIDARRHRRDDLGLAQSVRRQWHQAVWPRRLQAQRQGRACDRTAPRERARSSRSRS